MPLNADQLVSLACQDAKAPGYISQGFDILNMVLGDLCQTYDFDIARGVTNFNFNPGLGSGPYPLPADYLRADIDDVFWTLDGVKYVMIPIDLAQFDGLVQQAGLAAFPATYATDMSRQNSNVPVMYVWVPPSGAFPVTVRYRRQMPDVVIGTSASIWFPNQTYLRVRVAGELMRITDDERYSSFLGDGPTGAQGILDRYLKLKDDKSTRSLQVRLDRRNFGGTGRGLPNTKNVGF